MSSCAARQVKRIVCVYGNQTFVVSGAGMKAVEGKQCGVCLITYSCF